MDLTKLSDSDLMALKSGKLSNLSDAGLMSLKETSEPTSMMQDIKQGAGNLAAGAVRGAGSIGATAMRILPNALGGDNAQENEARRQQMDAALQSMGAQPDSWMYKGGKLAGEIAGTAGTGGVLAKGATALGATPAIGRALASSGMTTGLNPANAVQRTADMVLRTGAGALTGGAAAGLVNPEDAAMGAAIGGAAPSVLRAANAAGSKIGGVIRGPAQTPEHIKAIDSAISAGLVIPPSQANPTLKNRALEGFAGKLSTAQNASARNSEIFNALTAKDLGLAQGTQITPEVLQTVRKTAGQAYDNIGNAGMITPGKAYDSALDMIASSHMQASKGFPNAKASPVIELVDSLRSPSFDASSAISKIKELRSAADDAFRTGNTDVARASKAAATALEDAIEGHLKQTGSQDLLTNFRDARQLIAKTYSAEKALNPTTGTIDATKLGALLKKGKPLSGGMRDAADFANRFPKAAQPIERMGSLPQMSPLDWMAGGVGSAATGNPLALGAVLARPAARSLALSKMVQGGLAKQGSNSRLAELLRDPGMQQLVLRGAPIVGAQ